MPSFCSGSSEARGQWWWVAGLGRCDGKWGRFSCSLTMIREARGEAQLAGLDGYWSTSTPMSRKQRRGGSGAVTVLRSALRACMAYETNWFG